MRETSEQTSTHATPHTFPLLFFIVYPGPHRMLFYNAVLFSMSLMIFLFIFLLYIYRYDVFANKTCQFIYSNDENKHIYIRAAFSYQSSTCYCCCFFLPKFYRNNHTHQAKEKRLLSKSIRLQVSHLLINKQQQQQKQKQKSNYVVFDRSKNQNFCNMNVP